ncbi:MAG: glycosyl hydrolase [Verrucomicrobiota bacterium]
MQENNGKFMNPDSRYRGKPFWAWNGKLEESELRRQLNVMKEMGLGGAFMHSRVGLATDYLSDEWFRLVRACADQCRKNGMEAWMYDEDRWPSGAAGGLVTKNPRYRMRLLKMTSADAADYKSEGGELVVFIAKMQGNTLISYRKAKSARNPDAEKGEKILAFKVQLEDNSPWYNGFTYLDTMSDVAVKQFIKLTHAAYAKNCKQDFGKLMPGIFTDEPNYGMLSAGPNTSKIPWTGKLLKTFKKLYGYDLTDKLPEVIFRLNGAEFSKARHDYFETCTHLFTNNFGRQIYEWCARNKVTFTGHVLSEESLPSQTRVVGTAMRFYEYMQAPGIDILCSQGLTRAGSPKPEYLTAKQCSSVLDQFGRKWMLSELYGCTGWHFTFAEHKAVGDWQAALGVNLRCQHLAWYTMEGEAKRDYPASISFHSPWWRDYPVVENYFARVNYMLTQGRAVRDVAVIHPIESAWGVADRQLFDCDWDFPIAKEGAQQQPAMALDDNLKKVQQILLEEHFDFEYVDEDILARHGQVKNGRFNLVKSSYSTVVVPPAYTLRQSTCEMLAKFAEAGGNVIFVEPTPAYINAEKCGVINAIIAKCTKVGLDRAEIVQALSKDKHIRKIVVKTADGKEYNPCLYMLRQDKHGRTIVFICHTLQDSDSGEITVEIPADGVVQERDAITGDIYAAAAQKTSAGVKVKTILYGYGSRLFVVDPQTDASLKKRAGSKESRRQKIECGVMNIFRDEPNAFPLDVPEYSLNGGEWKKSKDILKVDDAIRDFTKWARRGGAMCQPWTQKETAESKKIILGLRYTFAIEDIPAGPCHLVMERPEKFSVVLNGCMLKHDKGEGWWIDNSFQKLLVPARVLCQGQNELLLTTRYGQKDNLEAIYFTGEFGFKWVNGTNPVITKMPATLKIGDWCEQGFPCYSSAITYSMELDINADPGKKIVLEVPDWKGALVRVHVNGRKAGNIAWKPYEVEITNFVVNGKNKVAIEVVGTRRNLLGPLHLNVKYPNWTGPDQYKQTEDWTDEYVRFPYGLMGEPFVSFRE